MIPTAPYDARAIANFLLDLAAQRRLPCTQMVLYKLMYFAHGWYLSFFERPLVQQEFEAWKRGPVIKVVRDEFRMYRDDEITTRAHRLDIYTGIKSLVSSKLQEEDEMFILNVFDSYYHFGAWKLSEMTHETGSPWDKLWNSPNPVGRLALRIKNEEIKAHFDGLGDRLTIS
jgi:uncharacterized phage-associated protein